MDNKSPTQSDWILHYISALYLQTSHQYSKGFDQFSRLESIFKGNITLLLHMAECSFKAGNVLNAFYLYSQIRKLDVNSIDAMDRYAGLIKNQGKHIQLNKLANELLRVNDERPETWVALARYCESKEDLDRALHFVEKALSLNQRHVEAHLLKGSLLLSTNKPQEALSSYRNASKHTQDIFIYQGLMECYVALGKFKEALVVAKEALNIMPNNARALTLVGIVLLKFEGKTEKAKLVFQKALQADPKCSEAIVALVDVFCGEKKFDLAVKVLQHHLALHHTDFMHTKLGEVYFSKKEYALALGSFNTALAVSLKG